jgi:hypothetical protein
LLSTRNVQSAKVVNSFGLNIYDLLYHDSLILSQAAVKEIEDLLGGKKEAAGDGPSGGDEQPEAENEVAAKPKRPRKASTKTATKSKREAA